MDWEGVLNISTCTHRAHSLFWCPKRGGGGMGLVGTPIYEPDRYHRMYCLIAMVFKGLHP